MGRYPAEPLESKLAWMRERQQRRQAGAVERGPAVVPAPPREAAPLPQMLRVKQVAKSLGVSETTVRLWFASRSVIVKSPHSRRKSVMLIPHRALDDWLREHGPSSR